MKRVKNEAGIALLQVLLLSAVISLLALQLTRSARDQVMMAGEFESRARSQLGAHSAFSESIFVQLSDRFFPGESRAGISAVDLSKTIQFYDEPILWRDEIFLSVQDLNGLLPQIYPEHILWRRLLIRHGLDNSEADRYLGVWRDVQDPDVNSWIRGDTEPDFLPSGHRYLDGYAQTDHVLRWVFADRPVLLEGLLSISEIDAPIETNIFNAPESLLRRIFDHSVVDQIRVLRQENDDVRFSTLGLLPSELGVDYIYQHNSALRRITVSLQFDDSEWSEQWIVKLAPASQPPFNIIRKMF